MCSFVVKSYKGRTQLINIRERSDIESLIFFPLFDVDDPNSILLYYFICILIHCYMHRKYLSTPANKYLEVQPWMYNYENFLSFVKLKFCHVPTLCLQCLASNIRIFLRFSSSTLGWPKLSRNILAFSNISPVVLWYLFYVIMSLNLVHEKRFVLQHNCCRST